MYISVNEHEEVKQEEEAPEITEEACHGHLVSASLPTCEKSASVCLQILVALHIEIPRSMSSCQASICNGHSCFLPWLFNVHKGNATGNHDLSCIHKSMLLNLLSATLSVSGNKHLSSNCL